MSGTRLSLTSITVTAPDPRALADFQPQEDVRVLFDPVGHPFCLFL
jgi:hypothetical protein